VKRHWHPTPEQLLLLHSALDRGPNAAAAWEAWRRGGGEIRTLDRLSSRLLPLIAKNLADNGVPEPELGLLRGVRRYAWVEHTERIRRLAPFAAALAGAGIQVLFLKGAALAPLYYGELGLRALADLDVLVRRDDVPRAVRRLAQLGVRPRDGYAKSLERALAGEANLADEGFQHSLPFFTRDGLELDLHWSVMYSNAGPHSDDAMWARAVPFSVAGVEGLTLCATDHLLHALVHGLSYSDAATIRWIADAILILRHGVDWTVLLGEVARRRLELPAREALGFLADEFGAPVPDPVRQRLAEVHPTALARLRYLDLLQDWGEVRPPWTLFAGVARFTEGRSPLDALRVSARYFLNRMDPRGARFAARQVALSLAGVFPAAVRKSLFKRFLA
jgi:hypothetical protein